MSPPAARCAALALALLPSTAAVADGLKLAADLEYRVDTTYVDPLELGGDDVTRTMWTDQRLRTNFSLRHDDTVELHVQADFLSGVLFGDTGSYGVEPSTNSGVALASKRPNSTTWRVGLRDGGDPLDPDSYVPVLVEAQPIVVNHAYADAFIPLGLIRVGRQPLSYGAQLSSHEGSRINRWGVSRFADTADRVMFATKLDEVYYTLRDGRRHRPNLRQDDGVFLAVFHDWLNQRSIFSVGDDTRQVGAALQLRKPRLGVLGVELEDVFLSAIAIHLTDHRFDSDVWATPLKAEARLGPLALSSQLMLIRGTSREVSEGFAALTGGEAVEQKLRMAGAQAIVDLDLGPVTATMELDYASGDDDPRPDTPITQFSFARDLNVGLLLFEQILAFESARSAAVGIENLAGLGSASFPLTEVQSDGRFHNALALFPQLTLRLADDDRHRLHSCSGLLMAWPAADGGAVDPILTALGEDGDTIADDRVNFHGGKPGGYYGTELDQQLEWTFKGQFVWTLEAAILFPGSSLDNQYGKAASSFMVDNRFTYLF